MVRMVLWGFILYTNALVHSASIAVEDIEDYYEYSDENMETETKKDGLITQSRRSRVLFENDEFDEENESSAINFRTSDEQSNQKLSFIIPESRLARIEMTLKEINEIFDKKKHMKKSKGKLTRRDKKSARDCRKKKLLFSTTDKKCHKPTSAGPCKNKKWFVAVKRQLQGVCRTNQCTNDETPIMFNGTCSELYGSCPKFSRLYLNKRGLGFCDCDEGYSYDIEAGTCYKEHTQGPCTDEQTWLRRRTPKNHKTGHKVFGKCKLNKCEEGQIEWKNKKCYKVEKRAMFDMCVENENGEMVVEDEVLTCKMVLEGRAVSLGVSRSCRRGRAWSPYRKRCVRVYSRG